MDRMKSERANKEKETVIKYEAPKGYEKLYFDDLRFFYASSRSDESFPFLIPVTVSGEAMRNFFLSDKQGKSGQSN